jgi:hypothetical protein
VSENFTNKGAAAMYATAHDDEAKKLSRRSVAYLAVEEGRALRESGGQRVAGGPRSRDEKIASILELRWPLIAEARKMLAEPEPGSETVTFTFPGGAKVTVPPMAEDPRVAAAFAMTDEAILKLVEEDSGSDYNEGVGEFGGYVGWHVEKDVLTVTVRPYTAEADDDPSGPIVRKWRLVPVEGETTAPGARR